jgi:hypothetical protein
MSIADGCDRIIIQFAGFERKNITGRATFPSITHTLLVDGLPSTACGSPPVQDIPIGYCYKRAFRTTTSSFERSLKSCHGKPRNSHMKWNLETNQSFNSTENKLMARINIPVAAKERLSFTNSIGYPEPWTPEGSLLVDNFRRDVD